MQSGRNRRAIVDVPILAAAFAAFFLLAWLIGSYSLCLFRTFTGLPCPGCGLTTATLALLRGDVGDSLRYHPLLLPLGGVLLIYFLRNRLGFCGRLHRSRYFYPAFLILFVGFFIVRLVLFFPAGPYPMTFSRDSVLYRGGQLLFSTMPGTADQASSASR